MIVLVFIGIWIQPTEADFLKYALKNALKNFDLLRICTEEKIQNFELRQLCQQKKFLVEEKTSGILSRRRRYTWDFDMFEEKEAGYPKCDLPCEKQSKKITAQVKKELSIISII